MPHKPFTPTQIRPHTKNARGTRRSVHGAGSGDGDGTGPCFSAALISSHPSSHPSASSDSPANPISLAEVGLAVGAAREDERRRLARELHDELGAHLTAFRYAFARLEPELATGETRVAAALGTAQQAFEALCEASRRIIGDLQPPAIEAGLLPALAAWSAQFQAFTGLPVNLSWVDDARLGALRPEAATALFRIAQEAVNNAAKHAKSARVDLRISSSKSYLRLCVIDYGRGFAARARVRRSHFGIEGMRARCKALNGELKISSKPGQMTQVSARLPWNSLLPAAVSPSCR
jgi:signal transduction histidine kinase